MDNEIIAPPRLDVSTVAGWARTYIEGHPEPDFTVTQGGIIYLQRWYIVPRNDVMNLYLHRFMHSDEDRAPHDHRGDSRSWVLDGEYVEHIYFDDGRPNYRRAVKAGDSVARKATMLHRVELVDAKPVISLFSIGPIVRDWGFRCPRGWIPWQDFVAITPGGNDIGNGCG